MAVLPTPGSPMSTGLFLVRRLSTCMTRRISSSRPITGIELAVAGGFGEIVGVAFQGLVLGLGILVGDALGAAHGDQRLEDGVVAGAGAFQELAGGVAALFGDGEQKVLGGDELVLEADRLRRKRDPGSG